MTMDEHLGQGSQCCSTVDSPSQAGNSCTTLAFVAQMLVHGSHRSLAIYTFLTAIRHGKLIPSRILDPLPTLHKLPNNARHGTRFLISGCVMFSRLSSNLDAEAGFRLAQKGRNRDPSRPSSCERRGRKFEIQIYLTSAGSAYSYSSSFSSSDITFLRSMLSITQCRPRGPSAGIYVGLY